MPVGAAARAGRFTVGAISGGGQHVQKASHGVTVAMVLLGLIVLLEQGWIKKGINWISEKTGKKK